ncbi:acetamidase/formamidase family protein [Proteinivorax hydrogeniformans]|uniref:Acetamidase/formamidase family protein n=1 Tax=Proteinivorax hydrogeniformans TaxID=1826727 RepID=A0AAU8HTH3_9FIRM
MKVKTMHKFDQKTMPIASLHLGEKAIVEVSDTFNGQVEGETLFLDKLKVDKLNPATGPFYIKSTSPNETLVVDIHEIKLDTMGASVVLKDLGVLGEKVENSTKYLYHLNDQKVKVDNQDLEISPFISILGNTPEAPISTGVPESHGGKLDCPSIKKNSKVLLPIFYPGSLLALGGIKAIQGYGQVGGTGIECSGELTFSCSKMMLDSLKNPMVISEDSYEILCSDYSIDKAIHKAANQWCQLLMEICGFSFTKSYHYLSILADTRVVQVVNPNVTVSLSISRKNILERVKIFFEPLDN